ncbi:MAG: protein BatD [Spirochaetes bacterium]|nr:protein BatD [Spirochaetota bacterium]
MKSLKFNKYIIALILLFAAPASAVADIALSLTLNRHECAITDSIKMVVSISGARDADTPQIRGLENFIAQNAGRSSQVRIINGRVNSSVDFTYYIQPKRIGIFEIGPASVKIDGKTYQSEAAKLTIKTSIYPKSGADAPIFLTASLSAKKVYLEEQLQYTIRLYHLNQVSNVSLNTPEAEGLEFRQLEKPSEYSTVYNSKNYQVIEIRYAVVPLKTGRLNINPARMSMLVRRDQRHLDDDDIFSMDDFFSNVRGKPVTLASNPLILNVLPVPHAGKPADYAGLIGTYQITSELTPGRVKAGESATFTVTVKGSGNVNRIPDMKMPEIKNAKIYADEPTLDIRQSEKGIEGLKTMKWAIVPEKQGQYTIPPLSVSYFDTVNKYYRTIRSKPFLLSAGPGIGVITQSPFVKEKVQPGKEEIEELGRDILPIHRSAMDLTKEQAGHIGWNLWIIMIIPALIYCVLLAVHKISRTSSVKLKSYKAAKNFYKICKDKDLSANALSKALLKYINKRFSINLGSLSPQEASGILNGKGCKEETVNQMEWILKKIETLIYTGKGEDPCDLPLEASLIIKSIEKEIK